MLKLFDRRFGNTSKHEPTSPKEASSDRLDHTSIQSSQSGEDGSTADEVIKTREAGWGHKIRKDDTNDGDWIAHAPGAQGKEKPGRPKVNDGGWPEDLRSEQEG